VFVESAKAYIELLSPYGVRSLSRYHERQTGSGMLMTLFEVAKEISDRLTGIFLRDKRGRRPVYGGIEKVQTDPHWRGSSRYRRLLDPVDAP
jgi:hypothetical protein